MFSMAELPNRKRKSTARLPVQKAIGNPSSKSTPRPPNINMLSHRIGSSRPIAQPILPNAVAMSRINRDTP